MSYTNFSEDFWKLSKLMIFQPFNWPFLSTPRITIFHRLQLSIFSIFFSFFLVFHFWDHFAILASLLPGFAVSRLCCFLFRQTLHGQGVNYDPGDDFFLPGSGHSSIGQVVYIFKEGAGVNVWKINLVTLQANLIWLYFFDFLC